MKNRIQGIVIGFLAAVLAIGSATLAATTSKQLNAYFSGIQIVLDGALITPKDATGKTVEPFIVDGTTYLPVRAMCEAIGKTVEWDGATGTVYVGEKPSENVRLSDLNYLASGGNDFKHNDQVRDNTDAFLSDCFTIWDSRTISYRDYLIKKQYSRIEGVFFFPFERRDAEGSFRLKIWGDNKLLYTSDKIGKGVLPIKFSVDIKNVENLRIGVEMDNYSGWTICGLSEVTLYA